MGYVQKLPTHQRLPVTRFIEDAGLSYRRGGRLCCYFNNLSTPPRDSLPRVFEAAGISDFQGRQHYDVSQLLYWEGKAAVQMYYSSPSN